MFERAHHQRIAHVLASLDGDLLREHHCLFGGGTCLALRHAEYRESVDIDFLVSDAQGYRALRTLLTDPSGINSLLRPGAMPLQVQGEIRADQYGIRMRVLMDGVAIKLEVVREARIALEAPFTGDEICGISTLTRLDLAASKLLANSDRQADSSVFSRDVIDLGMMALSAQEAKGALIKAELAYGDAVLSDLGKAIDRMQNQLDWLERCMKTLAITLPKAVVWQKIRALRKLLSIQ